MRRVGDFFRSILPILVVIALQLICVFLMDVLGNIAPDVFGNAQLTDVFYGLAGLLIFGVWYRHAFIRPHRDQRDDSRPRGFSFHTILAILFLSIGLHYVAVLVTDVTAYIRPDWAEAYNALVESAGYANPTLLLILYSVILAPLVEELVFRGLTMRYARRAGIPFVVANIWQAALFGVLHGNWMQGIYAFVIGLFFGFIAHRGRGIRYSIPVHMLFNAIGLWLTGLISITLGLSYTIAILAGVALTIFATWLFYTDFRKKE